MQSTATLSREGFCELAGSLFEPTSPVVFQSYSSYGQPLRSFRTASELMAEIESAFATGLKSVQFVVHFPDTKGHVAERKIALDGKKCDGHAWRYTVEGWGLVQLQADLRRFPVIECRIAVNTQARAEAWASTHPECRDPGLWDWSVVQRHAGRIIRKLKKLAEPLRRSNRLGPRGSGVAVVAGGGSRSSLGGFAHARLLKTVSALEGPAD